jgi:hypothetical protein
VVDQITSALVSPLVVAAVGFPQVLCTRSGAAKECDADIEGRFQVAQIARGEHDSDPALDAGEQRCGHSVCLDTGGNLS